MPSPVPAGYTRGHILFVRSARAAEESLWQRFWTEAGAYGSRIVLLAIGDDAAADAERAAHLFRTWESEQVTLLRVAARADAAGWGEVGEGLSHAETILRATALAILCNDALRGAALLGGTPLAQAVRRANARNKAIVAAGAGAAILCQHMGVWGAGGERDGRIAPGLGLVNRVLLDNTAPSLEESLPRLVEAVGANPFLVGVSLAGNCGVVIYPNATLEVFGETPVLVVDAAGKAEAAIPGELAQAARAGALEAAGVAAHRLNAGGAYNFNTRHAAVGPLSTEGPANKAAF